MKIIHSGSLDVHSGGPALSMWLTVKGLRLAGDEVIAVSQPMATPESLIAPESKSIFTQPAKFGSLAFVPGMAKTLDSAGVADLYHIQGVWMLHGYLVSRYARAHYKPYVVTLRGMLYPQALSHNRLVKKISLSLYQGAVLRGAAAIQCTCIEEMEHYRALGYTNPVAVIPNPIDTDGLIDRPIAKPDKLRIGYLGRVHPRKRIERLIYAFDHLRNRLENAELVIIGADDAQYESFLKDEVIRLGLSNVKFTGFLSGREKDDVLASISYLAVPSDFENFGNIVTEALVRGIPVYSSTGTPWQILEEYGCGWWVDNSQSTIDDVIMKMVDTPESIRMEMGRNAKRLVCDHFSVVTLGKKMHHLYQWILGKGDKPDFVYE